MNAANWENAPNGCFLKSTHHSFRLPLRLSLDALESSSIIGRQFSGNRFLFQPVCGLFGSTKLILIVDFADLEPSVNLSTEVKEALLWRDQDFAQVAPS